MVRCMNVKYCHVLYFVILLSVFFGGFVCFKDLLKNEMVQLKELSFK